MRLSDRIVARIVDDLRGRSGFDDLWDGIDSDIQQEIREDWAEIVEAELG